jgi:hypothetical protein
MMQKFVKREPERFAKLTLRFPPDLDSSYLMNVLYGLKDAAIAPCLKLEVARNAFDLDDPSCLKAAAGLLSTIVDEFLPPDAIAFLARLATQRVAREINNGVLAQAPERSSGLDSEPAGKCSCLGLFLWERYQRDWEQPALPVRRNGNLEAHPVFIIGRRF